MTDIDFLYVASLNKRLTELEEENEKLKSLLKKAVEDIRKILASECAYECDFCIYEKDDDSMCANPNNGSGSWCCENCKWKHHNEAMKLIGGSENG